MTAPEGNNSSADFDPSGIYVVVPAYREASVLPNVIQGLAAYVPREQIIVVNDGSPDDTAEVAKAAGVVTLSHPINRGQGAAIQTGLLAALRLGAEIIVTFDADDQHAPSDLPAMVEPIRQGRADVALGSRFVSGGATGVPAGRQMLLRGGVIFTRVISRIRVTDTHNGLRALSRKAAQQIRITQDGMTHASEILDEIGRLGLAYEEVPVHIRYSEYSMSKGQRNRDAIKLAMRIVLFKVMR